MRSSCGRRPWGCDCQGCCETHPGKTVEGQSLTGRVADGKVIVDNATVVKPDVMASSGIIHVIDTVPLPR